MIWSALGIAIGTVISISLLNTNIYIAVILAVVALFVACVLD